MQTFRASAAAPGALCATHQGGVHARHALPQPALSPGLQVGVQHARAVQKGEGICDVQSDAVAPAVVRAAEQAQERGG